jgi:hypothetical protein
VPVYLHFTAILQLTREVMALPFSERVFLAPPSAKSPMSSDSDAERQLYQTAVEAKLPALVQA